MPDMTPEDSIPMTCEQRRAIEYGINEACATAFSPNLPPRDRSCQQPRRGQEPGRRRPTTGEYIDEYGTLRTEGDFS